MRNNPGENIKIDWQINEIVKPGHINALTKAIKYDYVVTADKVTRKSSKDDEPDDLYELCGSPEEVDADISILINTTLGVTLRGTLEDDSEYIAGPLFKIDPSDFVSSGHNVHIYALCNGPWGGFGIKVESYRTVLIHTSGRRNAAIFLPGSERISESGIYVGSAWDMDQIDNSASRGGIVYEQACDGKLPEGTVTHEAWMSNGMGGSGGDAAGRLIIGDYAPADGYAIGRFTVPPVDDTGLFPNKPIDMSEINEIRWMPGSVACRTEDGTETAVIKGGLKFYGESFSSKKCVYRGFGPKSQSLTITGTASGGPSDGKVTFSMIGIANLDLAVCTSTSTNGGFDTATVEYDGSTYTGEVGGWSESDGTVSGSIGSSSYNGTIKSIKLYYATIPASGGLGSVVSGSIAGPAAGGSASVVIVFEADGKEGTVTGRVTSGGFTFNLEKEPAVSGGFHAEGALTYEKDETGKVIGSLSIEISGGTNSSGVPFWFPYLYLNTQTMEEDRLYHIRIEYLYNSSRDGDLPIETSYDYDATECPCIAGVSGEDLPAPSTQPIPEENYSIATLQGYSGGRCFCNDDSGRFVFNHEGVGTLCALAQEPSGIFSPDDPDCITTWSWGAWTYHVDGSLSASGTKTIDGNLCTLKVFIVGSHFETHVFRKLQYFKRFALKLSEDANPIVNSSLDSSEHRSIIAPRMFCHDDLSYAVCDNYTVPQWIGDVYLMKRDSKLYAWRL